MKNMKNVINIILKIAIYLSIVSALVILENNEQVFEDTINEQYYISQREYYKHASRIITNENDPIVVQDFYNYVSERDRDLNKIVFIVDSANNFVTIRDHVEYSDTKANYVEKQILNSKEEEFTITVDRKPVKISCFRVKDDYLYFGILPEHGASLYSLVDVNIVLILGAILELIYIIRTKLKKP